MIREGREHCDLGRLGGGLPASHELLLGPEGAGLFGHCSGVGSSRIAHSFQPFLHVSIGVPTHVFLVLQEVVVVGVEGALALGELLRDSSQKVGSVAFVLGSESPVLGVIAVLPHLPTHQPQLTDEFGDPGLPLFLGAQG